MKTRITTMIHKSAICILRLALVSSLVTPTPVIEAGQAGHEHATPAKLVQAVREATRQFFTSRRRDGCDWWASSLSWTLPRGCQITTIIRRYSKANPSCSSAARTAMAYLRFSSCTFGRGRTTPTVRS